jgi:hypothetical protein
MATLTVNFTASQNAVKYRIRYRKLGSSAYTTVLTTQSPVVINNVDCGFIYEGTVEAICTEGIPCNRYEITNTGEDSGQLQYVDCATGNPASTDISPYMTFFVCSRTEPIPSGDATAQTGVTQVAQGACVSPVNEQASGLVYWTASSLPCPPAEVTYYWQVTPCEEGAPIPQDSNVRTTNSSIGIGDVVKLTGSTYQDYCYTITDQGPTGFGVLINDAVGPFNDCNACLT